MLNFNEQIKNLNKRIPEPRVDSRFGISIYNYHVDDFSTTIKAAKNGKKLEGVMRWSMVDTEEEVIESISQLITKPRLKVYESKNTKRGVNIATRQR